MAEHRYEAGRSRLDGNPIPPYRFEQPRPASPAQPTPPSSRSAGHSAHAYVALGAHCSAGLRGRCPVQLHLVGRGRRHLVVRCSVPAVACSGAVHFRTGWYAGQPPEDRSIAPASPSGSNVDLTGTSRPRSVESAGVGVEDRSKIWFRAVLVVDRRWVPHGVWKCGEACRRGIAAIRTRGS